MKSRPGIHIHNGLVRIEQRGREGQSVPPAISLSAHEALDVAWQLVCYSGMLDTDEVLPSIDLLKAQVAVMDLKLKFDDASGVPMLDQSLSAMTTRFLREAALVGEVSSPEFNSYMEHNEFELAWDTLYEHGVTGGSARFWNRMRKAAESMGLRAKGLRARYRETS